MSDLGEVPERSELVVADDVSKTRWVLDAGFLGSRWSCIWGAGCQGILDEPAEELGHGCCSLGVELLDEEEAMLVSALAACIAPERFQFAEAAAADGVFADKTRTFTRVVDGGCIFLNRPGFAGGAGCALHLEAEAVGEEPLDWKPSVCWQLPFRINRSEDDDGWTTARLSRWDRVAWGPEGKTMAWCCTEEPAAYVGDRPVVESLGPELQALVGDEVAVAITSALSGNGAGDSG